MVSVRRLRRFELEALVEVPADQEAANVEEALRFWVTNKDSRASFIFDSFTSDTQSLGGA